MSQMTVSKRLFLGFGLIIGLSLILSSYIVWSTVANDKDHSALIDFYDNRLMVLQQIEIDYADAKELMLLSGIYENTPGAEQIIDQLGEQLTGKSMSIRENLNKVADAVQNDPDYTPQDVMDRLNNVNKIHRSLDTWLNDVAYPIIQSYRAGDKEEGFRIYTSTLAIADELQLAVTNMINTASRTADEKHQAVSDATWQEIEIIVVLAVIIVALCAILGYLISRSIVVTLKNATDALRHVSEGISYASEQLLVTSNSLADSTTTQAAAIEETSALMNQTSAMIQLNHDHTISIKELVASANVLTTTAVENNNDLVQSMGELSSSSGEITKIASNISSLAFQTNLLSLNASVEAARAGDAGRSFSVVAEEVRKLALESSRSASETESIVGKNLSLTKQSIHNSDVVSHVLTEVNNSAAQTMGLLNGITKASEEQLVSAQQVHIALLQMEQTTQNSAAVSEEAAAAAHELREQAEHLMQAYREIALLVRGSKGTYKSDTPSSAPAEVVPNTKAMSPVPMLQRANNN
ncbi:MAG: methyl-accepting chemotaxis protein [Symbiobacteriaceae bacterium]|nr:methyl-accepting chemotaxis protein [Symbiobacteriaceae bacterium]